MLNYVWNVRLNIEVLNGVCADTGDKCIDKEFVLSHGFTHPV